MSDFSVGRHEDQMNDEKMEEASDAVSENSSSKFSSSEDDDGQSQSDNDNDFNNRNDNASESGSSEEEGLIKASDYGSCSDEEIGSQRNSPRKSNITAADETLPQWNFNDFSDLELSLEHKEPDQSRKIINFYP